MKKLLYLFPALLIFSLVFVACTPKDEPYDPAIQIDQGNTTENPGSFIAMVDATKYISQNTVGVLKPGNVMVITTYRVGGEAFEIKLTNPKVGTMILNSTDNVSSKITYKESASADLYTAFNSKTSLPTGTLTISSYDMGTRKITGTFSFTGFLNGKDTPTKNITQGAFNDITFFVQ